MINNTNKVRITKIWTKDIKKNRIKILQTKRSPSSKVIKITKTLNCLFKFKLHKKKKMEVSRKKNRKLQVIRRKAVIFQMIMMNRIICRKLGRILSILLLTKRIVMELIFMTNINLRLWAKFMIWINTFT